MVDEFALRRWQMEGELAQVMDGGGERARREGVAFAGRGRLGPERATVELELRQRGGMQANATFFSSMAQFEAERARSVGQRFAVSERMGKDATSSQ